jgi:hypothetical protein
MQLQLPQQTSLHREFAANLIIHSFSQGLACTVPHTGALLHQLAHSCCVAERLETTAGTQPLGVPYHRRNAATNCQHPAAGAPARQQDACCRLACMTAFISLPKFMKLATTVSACVGPSKHLWQVRQHPPDSLAMCIPPTQAPHATIFSRATATFSSTLERVLSTAKQMCRQRPACTRKLCAQAAMPLSVTEPVQTTPPLDAARNGCTSAIQVRVRHALVQQYAAQSQMTHHDATAPLTGLLTLASPQCLKMHLQNSQHSHNLSMTNASDGASPGPLPLSKHQLYPCTSACYAEPHRLNIPKILQLQLLLMRQIVAGAAVQR